MIDFELSEEQQDLQTLAREFVTKEVKPIAPKRDQQPAHRDIFQWDIVDQLDKIGFRAMTLAEKYGGPGAGLLTTVIVLEEVAAGDLGVAFIVEQTNKFVQMLQWQGTKEQCQRFLIPLRDDGRFLFASAATEADYGSDYFLPHPDIRVTTTAERDGDEWVINGTKQWSVGSAYAKLFFVIARTKEGLGRFLVLSDTPGVKVGHIHDSMAGRMYPRSEISFDHVRVPKGNRVEMSVEARDHRHRSRWAGLVYAAADNVGVARAAYEEALEYAKVRVQGGKRIIEHQAIGMMLADMFAQVEAARLLYWKAAWAGDHAEYGDPKVAAMSKVFSAEVAMKVATKALEIHGGYGPTKDFTVEKHFREAGYLLPSGGTQQILALRTARFLDQGL
jgi:alkylation response protein AidB-like acyl-CoA dehydrogenase